MNITAAIAIISQMREDGVIEQYALGGAVAANFYLEPADTTDLDVFVALEPPPGQTLISLDSLYAYLQRLGCQVEDKTGYVVVAGWPVQFLPVSGDPLLQEALENSVEKDVAGVPVRVFRAEHLVAIALRVGRAKDKARLVQFLEASSSSEPTAAFDEAALSSILERHSLTDRWFHFKRQMTD
jgi:hypothetical protein